MPSLARQHFIPNALWSILRKLTCLGIAHVAVGIVFLVKAILNVVYPYSRPALYVFLAALLICVYFISRIDNKYKK